jgi:hypothetical protein
MCGKNLDTSRRFVLASVVTVASLVCVHGCMMKTPIVLADIPTEQRLQSSAAVNVRLDPKEFTRTDNREFHGLHKDQIETGALWKRAFVGDESSRAYFVITSTLMKSNAQAAGFSYRSTYIIDGDLHFNGNVRQIHAEGTRAASMMIWEAARQAAELGIKDAADQCRKILALDKDR